MSEGSEVRRAKLILREIMDNDVRDGLRVRGNVRLRGAIQDGFRRRTLSSVLQISIYLRRKKLQAFLFKVFLRVRKKDLGHSHQKDGVVSGN